MSTILEKISTYISLQSSDITLALKHYIIYVD